MIRESLVHVPIVSGRKEQAFTNIKTDDRTEDNIEEELEEDIPEDTHIGEESSSSEEEQKLQAYRSRQSAKGGKPRAVSAVYDLSHAKRKDISFGHPMTVKQESAKATGLQKKAPVTYRPTGSSTQQVSGLGNFGGAIKMSSGLNSNPFKRPFSEVTGKKKPIDRGGLN